MADRTVTVNLRARVDQYKAAMRDAGASTSKLGTQVDQLGAKGAQSLSDMSNGLVNVGNRAGLAAGGFAILGVAAVKAATSAIEAYRSLAEQVDTYQDITGASAEESSKMVFVANSLGVSTDALASGMAKLARNVGTNADEFTRYGIEVARNKNGTIDLNGTLLNVADAFSRTGDAQQRANIANAAFGRGWTEIVDILERGSDGLTSLQRRAEELGVVLSDQDIDNVKEFNKSAMELQMALTGLAVVGARAIVPMLEDVLDGLTKVVAKMTELKDSAVGGWIGKAVGILGKGTPLGQVVGLLADLGDGSSEAADGAEDLPPALDDVTTAAQAAAAELRDYATALDAVLDRSFGVDEANEQISDTLAHLAEDIAKAREAGDAWATSLDASNTTGLANRQTLREIATGAAEVAEAMIRAGEDPTAAMQTLYAQLLNTLEGLGFNRVEAADLLDVLLQFPSSIGVGIDIDISKAEAALARLMRLIAEAPLGVDALEAEKWVARHGQASSVTAGGSLMPTITPSFGGSGSGSTKDPADEALRRRQEQDDRMAIAAPFVGLRCQGGTRKQRRDRRARRVVA